MRRTWRVHRWFSPSRESEPRFTKSFRSAFLVPMAALALAVAVDLERVLAASVCWLEPSLTEAPAPSLLHIEVKMALVGLIGARPQHRAKDAAGVVAHRFQEYSFGVL